MFDFSNPFVLEEDALWPQFEETSIPSKIIYST